jgi:hypothetical protein
MYHMKHFTTLPNVTLKISLIYIDDNSTLLTKILTDFLKFRLVAQILLLRIVAFDMTLLFCSLILFHCTTFACDFH